MNEFEFMFLAVVLLITLMMLLYGVPKFANVSVYGPRIEEDELIQEEVFALLEDDCFYVGDRWEDEILHVDFHVDTFVEYAASRESYNPLLSDFYYVAVVRGGEVQNYRIKEGTELYKRIRKHHESLIEEKKHSLLNNTKV